MKRRSFFKLGGLFALGTTLAAPTTFAATKPRHQPNKAKNILFLVSDGMSQGTLSMANMLMQRQFGKQSHWMALYEKQVLQRSLMETASSNSLVTDSAAGSSAWGGGARVPNGSLNIDANGKHWQPILQKFKEAGKKVGCVTTVPITHATPAGFCVNNKSRNGQPEIALDYLKLRFDVMMGGGSEFFTKRKDGRDLFKEFSDANFYLINNKNQFDNINADKPIMGVFSDSAMAYSIDYANQTSLNSTQPTLAEMTQKAISLLQNHPQGFVLQIEGGKVDWAAHANDSPALLYDQIAFDEAIGVAMAFAQSRNDTLVIITSDHGNGNPGLMYGKKANEQFDGFQLIKASNDFVLKNIPLRSSASQIRDFVFQYQNWAPNQEQAQTLFECYNELSVDDIANYRKLPFEAFAQYQKTHLGIGWISMEHTADLVELATFGPCHSPLKGFVRNFELHNWMLKAAGLEKVINN